MAQAAIPPALQDIHRRFEAAFNAGDMTARNQNLLRAHVRRQGADPARDSGIVEGVDGLVLMHGCWTPTTGQSDGTPVEVFRRQGDGSWRYAIDNPFVPMK